jgi:hypothetical protein
MQRSWFTDKAVRSPCDTTSKGSIELNPHPLAKAQLGNRTSLPGYRAVSKSGRGRRSSAVCNHISLLDSQTHTSSGSWSAGPWSTRPQWSKRDPRHGPSQLFSAAFQVTMHRRCGSDGSKVTRLVRREVLVR